MEIDITAPTRGCFLGARALRAGASVLGQFERFAFAGIEFASPTRMVYLRQEEAGPASQLA